MSHIDLVNRPLPRAFRGYDIQETDRLIQDMADALARVSDEKVALISQINALEEKLAEHRHREVALQQTLIASQRMGEELRSTAQKEAQLILEKARLKADSMVQHANARLARIMEEVADAKKAKTLFDLKLKNIIEEHLHLMDLNRQESASLETAMTKLAARNALTGTDETAPQQAAPQAGEAHGSR